MAYKKIFAIGRAGERPRVGDEGSRGRRDARAPEPPGAAAVPSWPCHRCCTRGVDDPCRSLWHWLSELAEVYARHAGRHGPNRLLPAEVLPAHDRVPGHGEASPQGTGSDRRTAEHSAPKACTRHGSTAEEEHTMAHDARHGSEP